jgi:hypothetical protein
LAAERSTNAPGFAISGVLCGAVESYDIQGQTIELPVVVRKAKAGVAFFDVDAAAAQAFLPGDAFEVAQPTPGTAQLLIALIDYEDNDLGDYLEVGLTLFVRPKGGPADGSADGTFIVHLPVDQSFTCEAGCTIWGFPKTVQDITADHGGSSSTWTLTMDGQLVLRITVPRGGTDESPDIEIQTYTYKDGVPHTTAFSQGGSGSQMTLGPDGVDIELGDHPIAKELAAMGLPKPASMASWTEEMHGTFGPARPL